MCLEIAAQLRPLLQISKKNRGSIAGMKDTFVVPTQLSILFYLQSKIGFVAFRLLDRCVMYVVIQYEII